MLVLLSIPKRDLMNLEHKQDLLILLIAILSIPKRDLMNLEPSGITTYSAQKIQSLKGI